MHPTLSKTLILLALLTPLLLPLPAAAAPVSLHFVDADLATVLRAAARLLELNPSLAPGDFLPGRVICVP